MSHIDATGPIQHTGSLLPPQTAGADAVLVLLALSIQQMNVLQDTAQARLPRTLETQRLFRAIAPLSGELEAVRDAIIAQETETAQASLSSLESVPLPDDGATRPVTDADTEKFRAFEQWAAARGISTEKMTKTVPPPKDAPEGTPPTVVIDAEAVARNLATAKTYINQLSAGTADNAVLRDQLAKSPALKSIRQKLDGLKFSGDYATLAGLSRTADAVAAWTHRVAADLHAMLSQARLVVSELGEVAASLEQLTIQADNAAAQDLQTAKIRESLKRALQEWATQTGRQLKDADLNLGEFLEQIGDELARDEESLAQFLQSAGTTDAQIEMSDALGSLEAAFSALGAFESVSKSVGIGESHALGEAERQLSMWSSQFEQSLAGFSQSPGSAGNVPLGRMRV